MLKNYLKIAIRNLLKHRGYSLINIAGLAVGIACCWLILLFVHDELRYDRFHQNADRIYRVTVHGRMSDNEVTAPSSPAPMAAVLAADYPEVIATTRLKQPYNTPLISYASKKFNEDQFFFADSTFFDVFTFPLINGDPRTALRQPFSVVITEEMAAKYFGDDDPIGEVLQFNNQESYRVTGVAKNVPRQSHFQFDFLASFNSWEISRSTVWVSNHLYTYLLLQENYPAKQVSAKLPALVKKYVGPQMEEGMGVTYDQFVAAGGIYEYALQPLTDIHLHSHLTGELEPNGNINYVVIFSLIAFFILLIACINFMNLATARSTNRAREVGLRKAVGSSRLQLVRQFLLESLVVSGIAVLLAIGLVELSLPAFNNLSGKLFESALVGGWKTWPILVGATLLVGILAGSYPAFFLAAFRPVVALKAGRSLGISGHATLRKILVVSQFAISIVLMIGTFVVHNQLQYIRERQLGFDKEHVVVIHRAESLGQQVPAFENEVSHNPQVVSTAATMHLPGRDVWHNAYQTGDTQNPDGYILGNLNVGHNFVETLGLELIAGRTFSREYRADSSAFIINEAAAKKLGWVEPLGKILINPGAFKGPVVGVVKDFHFESLHEEVRPAVLNLSREGIRFLVVRIAPEKIETTIANLRTAWQQLAPEQPFEYSFLDEDFDRLYRADQRTGAISATFSSLSIFVATLGLFGLASFSSEQRTKEIGVRKVLGASVLQLIALLSKEFSRLVMVAVLIAAPIGYFVMNKWLEDFAYRIEVGWWVFALAGGMALVIALLTVSTQAIKAAVANPVKALRYE
jgi:putative ABC transport system permease protein